MQISLIFPHQLFEKSPLPLQHTRVMLIEEYLYFSQYPFHKQKIALQRAAMKSHEAQLKKSGTELVYIEATAPESDIRKLIARLAAEGVSSIHYIECIDNLLQQRLQQAAAAAGIELQEYQSPMFLNSLPEIKNYFADKKRLFQTDFYVDQRKKRGILLEGKKPLGGKWTFDAENRMKYPKNKTAPFIAHPQTDEFWEEALVYTEKHFGKNYGLLASTPLYPYTHEAASEWLQHFLEQRLWEFGHYEDAMVEKEHFLHHSLLTPMLNSGLLTPQEVLDNTLEYAAQNPDLPLNSLEGFIRQIMGWREFIRAVYELKGREERTRNYWGFKRKIPKSFYDGTTGIGPLDAVIRKVLKTGYCHHIERLMVLGNFMLLCEFDPDEVYRWFMELFIDAYDWVMVPNVYGMSQFADGGLMATKPYISGSNYLLKMSDFKKGEWQEIWDALFWRFMHVHRDFFLQNPRLGMLVHSFDKMTEEKRSGLLQRAEKYLGIENYE